MLLKIVEKHVGDVEVELWAIATIEWINVHSLQQQDAMKSKYK